MKIDKDRRSFDYSPFARKKGEKSFELQKERREAARYAAKMLLLGKSSLEEIKKGTSKKFSLKGVLRNSDILAVLGERERTRRVLALLLKTPTRTLSGVSPVAVMPKPFPCVGKCTYCPKGVDAPQSYTGFEPMTMRAMQSHYDPRKQVEVRIKQYSQQGHPTDKCHLILMGGTFLAVPKDYRHEFLKGCFDAFNGFDAPTFEEAKEANEKAAHRVIGATFETRPDWCFEKEIDDALYLGGTQMELGVQTLSDEVYKKVNRGHTVEDVAKATRLLKNSAFKVGYHMMPGLFATPDEDEEYFRMLFEDERFRPDMLKIYPAMVLKGTPLYAQYEKGEFVPYTTEEAAQVIAKITKYIPKYTRVMRVQRDIPSTLISAGVKHSNLRQLVDVKLKEMGLKCACIRCREIGSEERRASQQGRILKGENDAKQPDTGNSERRNASGQGGAGSNKEERKKGAGLKLRLQRMDYEASGGQEIFLSFEDKGKDALAGFCRLRIPQESHRKEIDAKTALIRELHVYGSEVAIGKDEKGKAQHQGLGKRLLFEAQRIASEEFERKKMLVISGVGAREYYYRLGYKADGPYVSKTI